MYIDVTKHLIKAISFLLRTNKFLQRKKKKTQISHLLDSESLKLQD